MRIFGKRPPPSATLIGKLVQVGGYELKVEAHLGEGGFASIYRVRDLSSQEVFALKHIQLQDGAQTREEVCHEAKMMKKVAGHSSILCLIAVAFGGGPRGKETDAYMLLDLCTDTLHSFMQSKDFKLPDATILDIMHSACLAIGHMHSQFPPIAHRDVKVENILQRPDGKWVLCDFGSASSSARRFDNIADSQEEEEYLNKKTTPAYRAPEMWDLMQGYVIDTKVDIWALGCMLYLLCFGKLPFTGDSKLQVLSGKFVMPATRPPPLRDLISEILIANPEERPDIHQVIARVEEIREAIVSGNYSATSSTAAKSIPAPGRGLNRPSAPLSHSQPITPHANGHTANRFPKSLENPTWTLQYQPAVKAHSMIQKEASLPSPTYFQTQIDAAITAHMNGSSTDHGQTADQGKNRRSVSASRTDIWVADFEDSQWSKDRQAHAGEDSSHGGSEHRPGSGDTGAHPPLQQQLLGEVQLLRNRLKTLHEENAKLNEKVQLLEHQVHNQQKTIHELQRMKDVHNTDRKHDAPNLGRAALPINEPPQDSFRSRDVGTTIATDAPTAESNGNVMPQHSTRAEQKGSFWDTHTTEGTDPPSSGSKGGGAKERVGPTPSIPVVGSNPLEVHGTPGHRRIVSDPPPMDSWHLEDDP